MDETVLMANVVSAPDFSTTQTVLLIKRKGIDQSTTRLSNSLSARGHSCTTSCVSRSASLVMNALSGVFYWLAYSPLSVLHEGIE